MVSDEWCSLAGNQIYLRPQIQADCRLLPMAIGTDCRLPMPTRELEISFEART